MAFSLAEGAALLWIQEFLRGAVLDPIVSFYTQLGNAGLLWIALSLLLLIWPKTRRAGFAGLVALLLSLIFTNGILKHLVSRPRPWLTLTGLVPLVVEKDPNSFPSGHTCAAFAAAVAWWRTLPDRRLKVAGLVLAVLMGLSRLYVGVHYPSDVLGGAVFGTLYGLLAVFIVSRLRPVKKTVSP